MRIAFITPEFVTEPSYNGGLANYLDRVSRALSDHGHEIHVFTKSHEYHPGKLDHHGVQVHRVVPRWSSRINADRIDPLLPRKYYNFYQDLKSAWCLYRAWKNAHKSHPFDLIQTANVSGCGYFFHRMNTDLPIVTRLSNFRPLTDKLARAKVDHGLKLRWKLEQRSIEGCKYLYAPSNFVARETSFHYSVGDVAVIESPYTPLARKASLPPSFDFLGSSNYLLFFGHMNCIKGVHVIANALPRVFDHHSTIQCVFVGSDGKAPDGDESMRNYVSSINRQYLDRLHFFDPVRHDDLHPIVQNSHAVLNPSVADNLPNTCLEAMGCSRIVIAADGSSFEQLITHGYNGFLAKNSCPTSLADQIEHVLSLTDRQRDTIGERACASLERLHPAQSIPKLIDYYQSVARDFSRLN